MRGKRSESRSGALGPFSAAHVSILSGLRGDSLWGVGKLIGTSLRQREGNSLWGVGKLSRYISL